MIAFSFFTTALYFNEKDYATFLNRRYLWLHSQQSRSHKKPFHIIHPSIAAVKEGKEKRMGCALNRETVM